MMDSKVLRRAGRAGVVVAGGALALTGLAAGTASAHEAAPMDVMPSGTGLALPELPALPVVPDVEKKVGTVVDGFVVHWGEFHYQHSLIDNDVPFALAEPGDYIGIHKHMADMMLGEAPLPTDDEVELGAGYPQV
jgi:hypothetical protein